MKITETVNSLKMTFLSTCTMTVSRKPNPHAIRHHWKFVTLVCLCLFFVSLLIPTDFLILLGHFRKKKKARLATSAGSSCCPMAYLHTESSYHHLSFFWSGTFQWKITSSDNANLEELKDLLKCQLNKSELKVLPASFKSNTNTVPYETFMECFRVLAFQIHSPGTTWSEPAEG